MIHQDRDGLIFCIANKLPGDTGDAGQDYTVNDQALEYVCLWQSLSSLFQFAGSSQQVGIL